MRAVVQRVYNAQVSVDGIVTGRIEKGLLVYLGVAEGDTGADAGYLADKVCSMRICDDTDGKMNLSVQDTGGSVLVVSQFTLLADARTGRRPSYSGAAKPVLAKKLYEDFIEDIRSHGLHCESGVFQAQMAVQYTNDGPVTILLDSRKLF
ncbi:MAG: D-tyrosyl-tRNA(Tyr) deacylase [Treponema sp.]|nr:D-tyrosyl-tRNA(Tyr) deacylase [Treponema sp.]